MALEGFRTWACMKLIFDDLFLLQDRKSNLIRIGNQICLLLEKSILWAIFYKPLLKMATARACLNFVFFFLLKFDQETI